MGNLLIYISMGTIMSIMLLFTRSSRIRRANVGSRAILFKSLSFGPFTLKRYPGVFKLKWGLQRFKSLRFRPWKHWSSVNDRRIRSKLCILKQKRTSVNRAWDNLFDICRNVEDTVSHDTKFTILPFTSSLMEKCHWPIIWLNNWTAQS